MYGCTFFGHRDCPADIEPVLKETIERLITREGLTRFSVGDSDRGFDEPINKKTVAELYL